MVVVRAQRTVTCAVLAFPLLASFALEACAGGRSEANPPSGIAVQAVPPAPSSPAAGQEPGPVPMAGIVVCGGPSCDHVGTVHALQEGRARVRVVRDGLDTVGGTP
jgi:hypothetical protein